MVYCMSQDSEDLELVRRATEGGSQSLQDLFTRYQDRLKTIDKARKAIVKVPKKYTDVQTTPLSVEVKEGEQTINLELKD